MADVTLKYKGATISEISESGNKTIETAGKYCEADILLEYVKPQGESIADLNIFTGMTFTPGYFNTAGNIASQSTNGALEYTTDYIDVSEHRGDTLYWSILIPNNSGGGWCAYYYYDENKAKQTGRVTLDGASRNEFIIPETASFLRFSFRTWNQNTVTFATWNKDELFRRLKEVGFANPYGG